MARRESSPPPTRASIRSSMAPSSMPNGAQAMKAHGTYFSATLMAFSGVQAMMGSGKLPPESEAKAQQTFAVWGKGLNLAYRSGVKIALGTDSAVAPHNQANKELELMVTKGGMTSARCADRRDQGRAGPSRHLKRDRDARSGQVGRPDCSRWRPVGRSGRSAARRLCHGRRQAYPDEGLTEHAFVTAGAEPRSSPPPLLLPIRRLRPAMLRPPKRKKKPRSRIRTLPPQASRKTPSRRSARSRCGAGRSSYTVTPGHLTIRDDDGAPKASMFYVAYTVDNGRGRRSASDLPVQRRAGFVDHVAAHGQLRADQGATPRFPRRFAGPRSATAPNPDTLLDVSDLVFIDAPTTGLSRPLGKAESKDFFGVDKDLDAFGRTIQRYLTKYGRWNSPKFVIGESYGTTRAAGLSTRWPTTASS